jgi:6-phosphogluconolactonase
MLGQSDGHFYHFQLTIMNQNQISFYVGCYSDPNQTSGISKILLDRHTGALSDAGIIVDTKNPSYLATSSNGLYTFNEIAQQEGSQLIHQTPSGVLIRSASQGDYPCHIDIDEAENWLALAHYVSGNVNLYKLDEQGQVSERVACLQMAGEGPNKGRQESSHAHMVTFLKHRSELMTVDLGTDSIHCYQLDAESDTVSLVQTFTLPAGSGPRHMVLSADETQAYVVCELTETLVSLTYSQSQWQIVDEQALMPDSQVGEAAAAIKMSPDGRFVYVSCRAQNTLVQFNIESESLTRVAEYKINGDFPRDFVISSDGQWMIVANQHSNDIESFARCIETGSLQATGYRITSHAPVCLVQAD